MGFIGKSCSIALLLDSCQLETMDVLHTSPTILSSYKHNDPPPVVKRRAKIRARVFSSDVYTHSATTGICQRHCRKPWRFTTCGGSVFASKKRFDWYAEHPLSQADMDTAVEQWKQDFPMNPSTLEKIQAWEEENTRGCKKTNERPSQRCFCGIPSAGVHR